MWRKALEGSVPAAKYMRERFGKGAAAVPVAKPVREEPLGKKAQADVDAQDAHKGTGWGELLPH
jgi:hypothetical protein